MCMCKGVLRSRSVVSVNIVSTHVCVPRRRRCCIMSGFLGSFAGILCDFFTIK